MVQRLAALGFQLPSQRGVQKGAVEIVAAERQPLQVEIPDAQKRQMIGEFVTVRVDPGEPRFPVPFEAFLLPIDLKAALHRQRQGPLIRVEGDIRNVAVVKQVDPKVAADGPVLRARYLMLVPHGASSFPF
jgi:hypothetical protein